MVSSSSNPDAAERHRWGYNRAVAAFAAGGSVHVLRASLCAMGYVGRRLEDEVTYQIGLRGDQVDACQPDGFVSGLPQRAW